MKILKLALGGFVAVLLTGCLGFPEGVKPVEPFEINRYLGKWYEIARLDHSFERGLSNVSAEYSLREEGGVKVINRGYSKEDREWSEAIGKAFFVEGNDKGYLKVSFFGPFYGSYAVFELGADYEYAFVSGNTTDYLWLLSRTPTVDKNLLGRFQSRAKALGFNTSELIYVDQAQNLAE